MHAYIFMFYLHVRLYVHTYLHMYKGMYRVCEIYYLRMSTVSFSVSQAVETSLIADLNSCLKARNVQSDPGNTKSC